MCFYSQIYTMAVLLIYFHMSIISWIADLNRANFWVYPLRVALTFILFDVCYFFPKPTFQYGSTGWWHHEALLWAVCQSTSADHAERIIQGSSHSWWAGLRWRAGRGASWNSSWSVDAACFIIILHNWNFLVVIVHKADNVCVASCRWSCRRPSGLLAYQWNVQAAASSHHGAHSSAATEALRRSHGHHGRRPMDRCGSIDCSCDGQCYLEAAAHRCPAGVCYKGAPGKSALCGLKSETDITDLNFLGWCLSGASIF